MTFIDYGMCDALPHVRHPIEPGPNHLSMRHPMAEAPQEDASAHHPLPPMRQHYEHRRSLLHALWNVVSPPATRKIDRKCKTIYYPEIARRYWWARAGRWHLTLVHIDRIQHNA